MHSEHASSLRKERVYYDVPLFRIDRVEEGMKELYLYHCLLQPSLLR